MREKEKKQHNECSKTKPRKNKEKELKNDNTVNDTWDHHIAVG